MWQTTSLQCLQDVWSMCVTNSNNITNVCMLLLRQGSAPSVGSCSQDWRRWSRHRSAAPPFCAPHGAWEEQDWWRIARGHVEQKNMKHPGAVGLLWCLAADDRGLLHLRQLTVCEVAAHPDASAALDQRHVGPHACLCARKNATWIETVKWKKCTWHWTMSAKIRLVILCLPTSDMALVHDVAHANLLRRMSKLHPTKLTS